MRQDQIESSADREQEFDLFAGIPGLDPTIPEPTRAPEAPQLVNLTGATSPAVLAGLLGIPVALIYQGRLDGKLPPNSDASYRDSIRHYVTFWKNRHNQKANNLNEASIVQEMRLREAKIEREWLAVKKDRGDLIDRATLAEVFEPVFLMLRAQLCSLARKNPDVLPDIDKMLESWDKLGRETFNLAEQEMEAFIQAKLEEEPDIGGESEPSNE
jgi:hypothetical protein